MTWAAYSEALNLFVDTITPGRYSLEPVVACRDSLEGAVRPWFVVFPKPNFCLYFPKRSSETSSVLGRYPSLVWVVGLGT
jgi:hypothetical protein